MTRSCVVKQISVVCISSAVLGFIKYAKFVFPVFVFPFYFICICCIIYSYVGIFIGNRRQRVAVQQHGIQMQETLRRKQKFSKTVGLILLVLCFTFLPALISPLILATLGFFQSEFDPFKPSFMYLLPSMDY